MHKYAKSILSTDLIDRGFGTSGVDFLKVEDVWNGDIITNPPYKFAQDFVEHAMKLIEKSDVADLKVAMFLKLTFLEGQARKKMFEKYPPKVIYVYSQRRKCALNGEFEKTGSSASAYAWFIWQKGFVGNPIIKWI